MVKGIFGLRIPKSVCVKLEINSKVVSSIENFDGMSVAFSDWRFNLRMSNTEPLLRLNVEGQNFNVDIEQKVLKSQAY